MNKDIKGDLWISPWKISLRYLWDILEISWKDILTYPNVQISQDISGYFRISFWGELPDGTNRTIGETIAHFAGLEDLWSRTFDEHAKCPSCMIGKSTLEDLPKLKDSTKEPLHQVNMDIFSSSVQSIEGYFYAVVLVDCNSGYRWIYCMKLKSYMLKVVKKWYSYIAILRQKHKLLVVMRDNAGESGEETGFFR